MSVPERGYQPPSIQATAFNCPHCHALAKQFWHAVWVRQLDKDQKPVSFTKEEADDFANGIESKELRESVRKWAIRVSEKFPFLGDKTSDPYCLPVHNVYFSQCFNCDDIAIWIADHLVYPARGEATAPNPDMPAEIARDYLEASSILDLSPRGSAALLRLAIQKICMYLGGSGDNINNDIAWLVSNGLDVRVQQALDVVRVVGNNAVHPGQIDLQDDRATAERLFGLVNLISEVMISQPRHVAKMYESLPETVRTAIEKRDKKLAPSS